MAFTARFTDYQFLPARYRIAYLDCLDEIAPEVRESFKTLCPTYDLALRGYAQLENDFGYMFDAERAFTVDDEQNVRSRVNEWYNLVLPEFRSTQDKEVTINAILDLQRRFQECINKYCLDTKWLRYGLFQWLGRVTYEPSRYDRLWFALHSYSWPVVRGEPVKFLFDGWSITDNDSAKEFKSTITNHFEHFLDEYIQKTALEFQKKGYKRATRKYEPSLVKWLVYWNVKRMSKDDILNMIDSEDRATGKKRKDELLDRKTLDAHFRRFKKHYDLPVRTGSTTRR